VGVGRDPMVVFRADVDWTRGGGSVMFDLTNVNIGRSITRRPPSKQLGQTEMPIRDHSTYGSPKTREETRLKTYLSLANGS
jgi:hypothetical protein